MEEYFFKRVTPEDYPLLKQLYVDTFKSQITDLGIKLRFDTTNLGCESIGYLAIQNSSGQAAAFYGVFPVKIISNGETIMAAQSADTMTHTKHRKKGLFTQLAKLTFEMCKKRGIQLVFGFPNDNSYPGFINKLDWVKIDNIVRYDLKLKIKTFPFPKVVKRFRFTMNLYLKYAGFVLRKKITGTPTEIINRHPGRLPRVLRDIEYIRYKASNDKFFLKLNNVVVWVKLSDVFWIGEVQDYSKITPIIIRKLKRISFMLGYNTISFHFNESVRPPEFLKPFTRFNTEPSCMFKLDNSIAIKNILFTAADFDTW